MKVFDKNWVNTYWAFGEFCFLRLQGLRRIISKGKVKVLHRIGHEGPEGEADV